MNKITYLIPSFFQELSSIDKEAGLKEMRRLMQPGILSKVRALPEQARGEMYKNLSLLAQKHPGVYNAMMDVDNVASVVNTIGKKIGF